MDDLVKRVAEIGQKAVAITDHGWIAGAVKFVKAAKDAGIKPIIGMETYVATSETIVSPAKSPGDNYHLTLLAADRAGYSNLMRLTSIAHLQGLSYKPRIDKKLLAEYAEGLIVLSGCIGAEIPQLIIAGEDKAALQLAMWYARVFSGRFGIELMAHGATGGIDHVRIEDDAGRVVMYEHELNDRLADIADRVSVPLVATNDAHYLTRDDGDSHDTLLCLGMGAWKTKKDRMQFPGAQERAWEFYIKTEEEMLAISDAPYWEEACSNTSDLADMIDDDVVPLGATILPKFTPPEDPGFQHWLKTGEL